MAGQVRERVKLSVSELTAGSLVDRDIYADRALLIAAGVTLSAGMIESFKRRGITEIEIAHDSALVSGAQAAPATPLDSILAAVHEVYQQHNVDTMLSAKVMDHATSQVEELFQGIALGQTVEHEKMRDLSRQLVALFASRTKLAVKLLDLDQHDRYTYHHSVNVGMLFMLVASEWAASQGELEELVYGAMLHDLGKARVGLEIINKPGKLTEEEWTVMRQHPLWSAEMLLEAQAGPVAVSIARWHHERLDGQGYPDGLKGPELDRFVRLSTICDVYDALTTTRSYKPKMDFAKAINIILQGCGRQFDPEIAHEFIRRVGRYPVGSFVTLSSGEIAVVLSINEDAINRPVVSRVLNADGSRRSVGEELDLTEAAEIYITGLATG